MTSIPRAEKRPETPSEIRLLVGVEPNRRSIRFLEDWGPELDQEVLDFWLTRGVSLLRCRESFPPSHLLDSGRLDVRLSAATRVHAKSLTHRNRCNPGLEQFHGARST